MDPQRARVEGARRQLAKPRLGSPDSKSARRRQAGPRPSPPPLVPPRLILAWWTLGCGLSRSELPIDLLGPESENPLVTRNGANGFNYRSALSAPPHSDPGQPHLDPAVIDVSRLSSPGVARAGSNGADEHDARVAVRVPAGRQPGVATGSPKRHLCVPTRLSALPHCPSAWCCSAFGASRRFFC